MMHQHFTTATFRDASPEVKPQMITDGLSYMQGMINDTAMHLRILNTWCENMPGLIEETASQRMNREDYLVQSREMIEAADDLMNELLRFAQQQGSLNKCLTPSL